jgi:hypothetical protein
MCCATIRRSKPFRRSGSKTSTPRRKRQIGCPLLSSGALALRLSVVVSPKDALDDRARVECAAGLTPAAFRDRFLFHQTDQVHREPVLDRALLHNPRIPGCRFGRRFATILQFMETSINWTDEPTIAKERAVREVFLARTIARSPVAVVLLALEHYMAGPVATDLAATAEIAATMVRRAIGDETDGLREARAFVATHGSPFAAPAPRPARPKRPATTVHSREKAPARPRTRTRPLQKKRALT